jgi:hypothetical protein
VKDDEAMDLQASLWEDQEYDRAEQIATETAKAQRVSFSGSMTLVKPCEVIRVVTVLGNDPHEYEKEISRVTKVVVKFPELGYFGGPMTYAPAKVEIHEWERDDGRRISPPGSIPE